MSDHAKTEERVREIQIVKLNEMKMVGFPINISFKDGDFSKIGENKRLFLERKNEISHVIDPETYWAPWYSCEVMFTYFYCLQVSELTDIPEGMMGFTIPESSYASIHYEGYPHTMNPDTYELLHTFRQANHIQKKENGMVLEKFRFDDDCKPGEWVSIDVLGPIKKETEA